MPAIEPADFAFDPARAAPFLTARSHNGWLGLTYRAHGEDWIVSLMDMASGLSIWTRMGRFQAIATLDLRVDYTRAAAPRGNVFGRATCYRTSRSAAFVHGIAHEGDPDDPVARMQGVFMTISADPRSLLGG